ncbi:MAG: hypothetical protein QM800_13090 [Paludibacter sp.]
MKTRTILLAVLTVFSSCTMNQKISYSTKDIETNHDTKLSTLVLDIEEFTDHRKDNPDNNVLFTRSKDASIDGKIKCINSEKNYKKEAVTLQLSRMLVEHLNLRNSFKKVVLNNKDTADYYIKGDLQNFYGNQKFSTAAAVGAQFGLIGALATAGVKTNGKIIFEINDLKIYDKNNQIVKIIGTFKREYTGDFPADAYCWCMFQNVNSKLKDYFSELIATVESEMQNTRN